ncbi:unnamed protein product [Leuciscus chuanchicus]
MGAGNSQVYNQTDDLGQEGNILKSVKELFPPSQTLMDNQSVNTSASQKDGKNPDPTNTCPVCFSALKPACIKGCTTSELLHCTQCLTTQLLCSSCLYPCTSAACPNKLCPIVSTLLTCEVVSDPKNNLRDRCVSVITPPTAPRSPAALRLVLLAKVNIMNGECRTQKPNPGHFGRSGKFVKEPH